MTPSWRRNAVLWVEGALSVFAWIGISLATLIWCGLMMLVYPAHPFLDPQRRGLHRMASWWGRTLIALAPGTRLEVRGLEQVPSGRPVVFMANHQSYVDVPALFSVPFQFRWLADEDLFRIPVFGWAMRLAGYIPVNRGRARSSLEALARAKECLRQGISILVFPEGTRSHTGVLGRFKTGGIRLALQAGVPIVPVVVIGTRQLLPRGSWIFRWGILLRITLLPPVVSPRNRGEVHSLAERVRDRMHSEYRRLLKEYPES